MSGHYRHADVGGCLDATLESRADGTQILRSTEALGWFPDRLTDSPVCLAADEGDLDIHLERFLKQHGQIRAPSTRVMEINPDHPLIRKMATKAQGEATVNSTMPR